MRVKEASDAVRKTVIYQINLRAFTAEGTLAAEKFLPDVKNTEPGFHLKANGYVMIRKNGHPFNKEK